VLEKEWLIVLRDTIRKVNLIGFDAAHAREQGLSVVTVDTIAKTKDGEKIILRAHQSVSNPSTNTLLLSEVQLRQARHVVDFVHRDHLDSIDEKNSLDGQNQPHVPLDDATLQTIV
jgi:hypothetical protein